jgi:hypothetical protein
VGLCEWITSPSSGAVVAVLVALSAAMFALLASLLFGIDWDSALFQNHASLEVLQDVAAHAAFIAPAVVAILAGERKNGACLANGSCGCSATLLFAVWTIWTLGCISVAWRCANERHHLGLRKTNVEAEA